MIFVLPVSWYSKFMKFGYAFKGMEMIKGLPAQKNHLLVGIARVLIDTMQIPVVN